MSDYHPPASPSHPPAEDARSRTREAILRTVVRFFAAIFGRPKDYGEGPKPPFR